MKTLNIITIFVLATFLIVASNAQAFSVKEKKAIGVAGMGYFDLNSDWESLYFNFASAGSTKTAGFGFVASFELGLADRVSGEISLGYSRLLYSSRQRTLIKENYFVADVVGHYYIGASEKFNPYVIFGVGAGVSGSSVVPVADVGFGMHFMLTKEFSVKTELLIKSAVIYNRGEARVGVAYHF